MNKLPVTARQLNEWLRRNFVIFEGPTMAYFELPFTFNVLKEEVIFKRRVTYESFGLVGSQEECCREMALALKNTVSLDSFADATEPLFMRTWAEYSLDASRLFIRLAFWNPSLNVRLAHSRIFAPQGGPYNKALRIEE